MRRRPVTFRPEAVDDLSNIFRFVPRASRNVVTAETFVRRIKARCDSIGDAPLGGRPRDDLEPGLRTVPFERGAVIAYKEEGKRVRITNIFYGRRDYDRYARPIARRDDMRTMSEKEASSSFKTSGGPDDTNPLRCLATILSERTLNSRMRNAHRRRRRPSAVLDFKVLSRSAPPKQIRGMLHYRVGNDEQQHEHCVLDYFLSVEERNVLDLC